MAQPEEAIKLTPSAADTTQHDPGTYLCMLLVSRVIEIIAVASGNDLTLSLEEELQKFLFLCLKFLEIVA